MKKGKKFLCLALSLISVFSFASCGADTEDTSGYVDELLKDVNFNVDYDYSGEITVWICNYHSEEGMMNAFVETFNKHYPNIKVNVDLITPAQYQGTIQKAANLDNMPDIYWISPQYTGVYDSFDCILPLTKVIEKDTSFSTDSIVAESLNCFVQGGETWALPRDYNQVVLYYNKDMFDAAGVAYPSATEAMTAAQFEQMMKSLYDGLKNSTKTNSYGQAYKDCFVSSWDCSLTWDSLIWPLFKSFNAEIIRPDGTYTENGKPIFDSEESLDALEWCVKLKQAGYIEGMTKLADSIAFKMEYSPMYTHMRCNMIDLITPSGQYKGISNLGIAPFPDIGDAGTYYVGAGSTGYAISKYTKNIVPAWLFLKSIVSEESQEALSKTGYATPANQALLDDPNAEWVKWTNSKVGEGYTAPFIYKKTEAYTHINDFLQYIDLDYQNSVYFDMTTLYDQAVSKTTDREGIKTYLTLFSKRIADYIAEGNEN